MGTVSVAQLSLALVESQANTREAQAHARASQEHARELASQLGAAHQTIAVLSLANHRELHPDPIAIRDLYEKFRVAHENHPCWTEMRNRLLPFVAAYGDRVASTLKPSDWARFRDERLGQTVKGPMAKSGRKMSKLTINHELGWAKRLFNWASDEEQALLEANPFARVKRQKCRKQRDTWITEADVQRLLAAEAPVLAHARLVIRAFLLAMVDTGLRFNEARKLKRDRIRERDDGRILVDVGRTKNGKPHMVGLTRRAFEALAEIAPVEGVPEFFVHTRREKRGHEPRPVLFSERSMRRWFREMCVAAGIDSKVADGDVRLRPHDMRHSAATLAHRRGAKLKAISRMLNHSDVSITVRYVHDEEDDAVEMAELMEAGIRKDAKPAPGRRKGSHRTAPPHVADGRRDSVNSTVV